MQQEECSYQGYLKGNLLNLESLDHQPLLMCMRQLPGVLETFLPMRTCMRQLPGVLETFLPMRMPTSKHLLSKMFYVVLKAQRLVFRLSTVVVRIPVAQCTQLLRTKLINHEQLSTCGCKTSFIAIKPSWFVQNQIEVTFPTLLCTTICAPPVL